MSRQYTIAEAKDRLPEIVHQTERSGAVSITRHGKPVARLVSESEYQRLARARIGIDWGTTLVDTAQFEFDREEANAR